MRGAQDKRATRIFVAFIIWLILAALVAALISHFTGEPAEVSDKTSEGFLMWVLELIFGESNRDTVTFFHHYIRKAAHFTLFAAFGLTLSASLFHQRKVPAVPFTLAAGALLAVCDEVRQFFVPGRSPEVRDVFIDCAGVVTGTLIVVLIVHLVRKRRAKKAGQELAPPRDEQNAQEPAPPQDAQKESPSGDTQNE